MGRAFEDATRRGSSSAWRRYTAVPALSMCTLLHCRQHMICPVRLAREMSALRAVKVGDHAQHDLLHEGRDGAGNESRGSHFAGASQADYVVAGGGDYRHQRPADATLAGVLRGVWVSGII